MQIVAKTDGFQQNILSTRQNETFGLLASTVRDEEALIPTENVEGLHDLHCPPTHSVNAIGIPHGVAVTWWHL